MPELSFNNVDVYWQGNDYKNVAARPAKAGKPAQPAVYRHVSMTSVAIDKGKPFALIFMTHMNIDFDGASNAYGPKEKNPLDYLNDAKDENGLYVGLMSLLPTAANPVDAQGMMKAPTGAKVKVDKRYPDRAGKIPVLQQTGDTAGYFVSTTSKTNPGGSASIFEQSHYLDSATVPYCALSTGIARQGVGGGDFGVALRLDSFLTADFAFLSGEGSHSNKVGECSYKVFLDIGGKPKKPADPWPDNNFPTLFVVCPGSATSSLATAARADHPGDLAAFIALQGDADARARGASGVAAFNKWKADGRTTKPAAYNSVVGALHKYNYAPDAWDLVNSIRNLPILSRVGLFPLTL